LSIGFYKKINKNAKKLNLSLLKRFFEQHEEKKYDFAYNETKSEPISIYKIVRICFYW